MVENIHCAVFARLVLSGNWSSQYIINDSLFLQHSCILLFYKIANKHTSPKSSRNSVNIDQSKAFKQNCKPFSIWWWYQAQLLLLRIVSSDGAVRMVSTTPSESTDWRQRYCTAVFLTMKEKLDAQHLPLTLPFLLFSFLFLYS